jgi:hypothetical protein
MPAIVELPAIVLASAGAPAARYRCQQLMSFCGKFTEKSSERQKVLEGRHNERVKILHF